MPFYRNDRADDWDHWENYCISMEYKFVFWPKRCHISRKVLWLEYAYKKTAMFTGPGDPIFEYRWYDRDEYVMDQLKQ